MPAPRRPEPLRGKVFRKRDVLARQLVTAAELRSSAWRRVYRGVYADAELADTFALRVAGAALLVPDVAAFSGRTAAFLHGATELVDLRTPVEVSVPAGVRFGPVAGMRVRQVAITAADVMCRDRRRLTTPLRTALDLARTEPLVESVAALDVLLARGVVDRFQLGRGAVDLGTARGAARARSAAALADGRAESPQESRLRVVLASAGLAAVPQFVVRAAGGAFVARVDLAFPDARVAVEYDGVWHAEPGQFAKDRRRLNALVAAGWTVLHVTAADLRDPRTLVDRVKALLKARDFREGAP